MNPPVGDNQVGSQCALESGLNGPGTRLSFFLYEK